MKNYIHVVLVLLHEYKQGVIVLLLVLMIADINYIRYESDPITFMILGLIIAFFKFYNFTSKRLFSLCIVPVVIIFWGFLIDPTSLVIEKASIWLFLLMGTGIVQEFFSKHTT